ncbi:CHAT domain-containing protein [Aureispira sp. CCB-E]|uniref:CHAT domain-containing protein n=1 Tax=Aureispira sp. CCB-E TaxID=3051121 RepID=UPI00286921C7|nr:CHAT domain-containing protein [Aureispira sp. CCB-E]WMX15945.1 CHAT domain-containing protein [Aureispira sp. CCB-E]
MLYKIILILFLLVNLFVNCLGQVDVAKILKNEGVTGLENLIIQKPSYQWEAKDFHQIYLFFKQVGYEDRQQLYSILGERLLGPSLSMSINRQFLDGEEMMQSFALLEDYRVQLKEAEKWNDWAFITQILAENAYYHLDAFSQIGRYYDELMSVWDWVDKKKQRYYAVLAGNHFMAVEQNYERAATYFLKVINSTAFTKKEKLNIYSSLSELYLRKKDFNRALEYGSIVLKSEMHDSIKYLQQLTRSGNIYKELGNFRAAEDCFLTAKDLLPKEEKLAYDPYTKINYSYVYSGLLEIQLERKKLKKAVPYVEMLEKHLPYFVAQGQGAFLVLNPLMQYYTIKNDTTSYLYLEKILKENENRVPFAFMAKTLTIRGDYWFQRKNLTLALNLYNRALDLLKNTSTNELVVYTQDEPQALETLTKKLDLLHWQRQYNNSIATEEDFYRTTQQARGLLDQIRQSLTTKSAKQKLLDNAPKIYEYSLEAIGRLYKDSKDVAYLREMFTLIEKSKAILLSEALNENLAQSFGGVPDTLRTEERNLANDIKIYESKLLDAQRKDKTIAIAAFQDILLRKRAELDQLKKHLEASYPKYYELKFQDRVVSVEAVQEILADKQATFVSYFVGERNLYMLSLTSDQINLQIETLVGDNRNSFSKDLLTLKRRLSNILDVQSYSKKKFDDFCTQSHRLYQLLLSKVVNSSKKIIISADGLLHYIPFETLLMEKVNVETVDFKDLPYLLKKYEVSYQYTASLWLELLKKEVIVKSDRKGILGMAATYQQPITNIPQDRMVLRQNLVELEGAKNEVLFLKQTFKGKFWLEASATEANFKQSLGNYSIVHLALHGLVNNKLPMKSGLVFTENGDTIEDNILFAYELSSLDLNTDLLVLSACSTGDGIYQKGEGVLSLGRGFMYAGAASILTTLWQINDQSTQTIMQYFYQNLHKGMEKDVALQQAKLSYLAAADGPIGHPVFWAAYVLIGDTGVVAIDSKTTSAWWWGLIGFIVVLIVMGGLRKKALAE